MSDATRGDAEACKATAQQAYNMLIRDEDEWTRFDVAIHLALAQVNATLYVGDQLKRLLHSRKT